MKRSVLRIIILSLISAMGHHTCLWAQADTTTHKIDSFLLKRKGLLGKLAKNIIAHNEVAETVPVRNDLLFKRFEGKAIRNIFIMRLDFGIPISDTGKRFKNRLTQWANDLHHNTNEKVIRNNLFFEQGESLVPSLVADNERHLRDLPYLQDASIKVIRAGADSVDVMVMTKDVLSIGGSYRMHNLQKMSIALSEDNLAGWGHEIVLRSLFDNTRRPKFSFGGEYIARNIGGSFIDWYGGSISFNRNLNTNRQNETRTYTGIVRPLVNPYMKFTYAAEVSFHETNDAYAADTSYFSDHRYRYYNYDGWIGWNAGSVRAFGNLRDNRARVLIGLRYLQQDFTDVPGKYIDQYHYLYADLQAVLSSITVFRQDFYKTKYVLGFGRNEDIPEGGEVSLITGWTKKAGIQRPYLGLDIQRYYFTSHENYFNYTLKADAYLSKGSIEDVNLLFNLNFFSRLMKLGKKWSERNFVNAGIAHQPNRKLNEPLFLQSDFGLREWRNDTLNTGNTRITLKGESVFFAPWNFINFRFAPFVFANLCFFTPVNKSLSTDDLFTSLGGGIRTRNESLIFETMEFRAYYFPKKNFFEDHWRFEVNTNIRFRYRQQFIKKPAFVDVNRI